MPFRDRVVRAVRALQALRVRTPSPLVCAAAVALAAGCGVEPVEGAWNHTPGELTEDTCTLGSQTPTDEYGQFTISAVADDTFTISTSSAEDFSCVLLGGGDFECPDRIADSIDIQGLDAVIDINVRVDGKFSNPMEAKGEQTFSAACVGPDCSGMEIDAALMFAAPNTTLPCSYTVGFTAVAL